MASGDVEKAELLYSQLTRPTDMAVSSLIDIYGKRQNAKQLDDLIQSLSESIRKEKLVYCSMIDALVNCGKLDQANDVCKEMLGEGHSVDAVTLSVLVNNLSKNGMHKKISMP